MTIISGNLSLIRFKILENSSRISIQTILSQIRDHMISPLDLDDIREESVGFCNPYSGEPHIEDPHALVYDNAFLFALRIDKKKIPGTYFKLYLKNALDAMGHNQENETGQKRSLSKKICDQIKNNLKETLLKSTLPSIRIVEILWHLDNHEIWFFSTSTKFIEEFEKLFLQCFSLPLVLINPGTSAVDLDRIQLGLDVSLAPLMDLVPISFFQEKSTQNKENSLSNSQNFSDFI